MNQIIAGNRDMIIINLISTMDTQGNRVFLC